GGELFGVRASVPRVEVGDEWGRGAQEHQGGAEGQHPDGLGGHDLDAAHGSLNGAGTVVADGGGVGDLVAFAEEGGDVLEVFGDRGSAEDDFDDGGVPDRSGVVVTPPGAGLGQGLQDGHGGDPGAAAFGHEHG